MNDNTGEGMLYLCATPIGNLSDISERVLETLRGADIIAAEDTRNSIKLLNHFDIRVPMTSYHEHNRYDKARELIGKMKMGAKVALITDAGTPAISDPGQVLTDMCHKEGIKVTSLPGPCALITALALSGIDSRRFVFEGFLPSEKKSRRQVISDLTKEKRTIIIYEAPHHLKGTLSDLYEALGDRGMALCRELTKKFEEVSRMSLKEAKDHCDACTPRGEYVLVIEGADEETGPIDVKEYSTKVLKAKVDEYTNEGMDHMEAMKKVAADLGVSKRDIYRKLIEK